jgi:hypothetical protein
MKKKQDYFIDTLVHELIHQLFAQNSEKLRKAWKYIGRKYKKESFRTRIHIPLHAIHTHIYLKFFGKERLKRNVEIMSSLPDYKRSWEIVQKEGYKKIIQEFVKQIQKNL